MTTGRINLVSIVQGARGRAAARSRGCCLWRITSNNNNSPSYRRFPRALLGRRRATLAAPPREGGGGQGGSRQQPHFEFESSLSARWQPGLKGRRRASSKRPFDRRGSSSENTREEAGRPDALAAPKALLEPWGAREGEEAEHFRRLSLNRS